MTWRPSRPWRWAVLCGVFLLTLTPMAAGVWVIWTTGEHGVFPMALIAFGPITVLSLFVALTPVLEGRWLRKRRGRGDEGG